MAVRGWREGGAAAITPQGQRVVFELFGDRASRSSGLRTQRIEFLFGQRTIAPRELDRDIVKPARREAAVKMPQAWNDNPDHRHLDIGTRLIEDQKIQPRAPGNMNTRAHLLARLEPAELCARVRPH